MAKEKKTLTNNVDMMDLDMALRVCKDQTVDNQYAVERSKSPKSKRSAKQALMFWASAYYYLSIVESMTDDEFLAFEQRAKEAKEKEVSNG